MAAYWIWAIKTDGYFSNFDTKILTLQQNSLTRNWMPEQLSGLLINATRTPPWLLRSEKVSTSSELYPDYLRLSSFLYSYWLASHQYFFFNSFAIMSVRLPLITYPSLCSTYVIYRTPCHAIGHQMLPKQQSPRKVEDLARGDKHFKHVSRLTYLIYFSPKGKYIAGSTCMPKSPQGILISLSVVWSQRFTRPLCF